MRMFSNYEEETLIYFLTNFEDMLQKRRGCLTTYLLNEKELNQGYPLALIECIKRTGLHIAIKGQAMSKSFEMWAGICTRLSAMNPLVLVKSNLI